MKQKKLSFFPQLYKLKIRKYDTKEKKIYYFKTFRKLKFCEENRSCYFWHYYFKKNKTNKIGFCQRNSLFLDKAVVWYHWIEKAKYNNYEIGFTDIENKKCFYDLCKSMNFLKDGIVYKKYEENKYLFYYVDYQSFEKNYYKKAILSFMVFGCKNLFLIIVSS